MYAPKGIAAQGVLVFQGDQGVNKTRWGSSNRPPGTAQDGLASNLSGSTSSIKDSVERATTRTFGELGEFESTYARQMPQLEAFVTSPLDRYRPAYGPVTNDSTGNRRWWVIPTVRCVADHSIDLQRLWAQIFWLYEESGGQDCAPLAGQRGRRAARQHQSEVHARGPAGVRNGDAGAIRKLGRLLTKHYRRLGWKPVSDQNTSRYRLGLEFRDSTYCGAPGTAAAALAARFSAQRTPGTPSRKIRRPPCIASRRARPRDGVIAKLQLRARAGITTQFGTRIHPAWRRCASSE